jgi:hypothetical protein
VRERSAETARVTWGTSAKAPRLPLRTGAPFRRSTVAILYDVTEQG